ncbi:hypothetical protein ABZ619_14630 [Streptomyces sp. NPDC007851]
MTTVTLPYSGAMGAKVGAEARRTGSVGPDPAVGPGPAAAPAGVSAG